MAKNLVQKILSAHLVEGEMRKGGKIAIRIDHTLTQDTTGTMTYLQFESMGVPRVKTERSVSYVDHNILQMGYRNPDDHRFLRTAAARFGAIYSPTGTGICHQLQLENFAIPGKTLIGADSHTPMSGGIGCFAMGAGGLSVAMAMAGHPYPLVMPEVVRVVLKGRLRGWAQAKDIILELLRRLTVKGGVNKVFEYAGDGVATLTVPERATITNMGAELGATTSIFPSDAQTKRFLEIMGRPGDWTELAPDRDAAYDAEIAIDLDALKPLAACPHMPDKVVEVASLAGLKVDQVAIGSCTNSSYRDLSAVARLLKGRRTHPATETLISPGSKQVLTMLAENGHAADLLAAGARILECGCGPCIGIGGSPVSGGVSVRSFNRNFLGRSGTPDAQVYLVSPLTAAQVALAGEFTDPAGWGEAPELRDFPENVPSIRHLFIEPPKDGSQVEIIRGPNIQPLPRFEPPATLIEGRVVLKVGDNITTDHIMPAGAEVMSLRSNIPAISRHVFAPVDPEFPARAQAAGSGVIIAGSNYGQGSSREHAALAPRYLGIRAVIAKSFARIHRDNLVNFGILPLIFLDAQDYDEIEGNELVRIPVSLMRRGEPMQVEVIGVGPVRVTNDLTELELAVLRAGGLLAYANEKARAAEAAQ